MDTSEESKEGKKEPFRSGPHPSGGRTMLGTEDQKQSSEV